MKTYDEELILRMDEYIKTYQKDYGRSPSYRKIMNDLKLDSLARERECYISKFIYGVVE